MAVLVMRTIPAFRPLACRFVDPELDVAWAVFRAGKALGRARHHFVWFAAYFFCVTYADASIRFVTLVATCQAAAYLKVLTPATRRFSAFCSVAFSAVANQLMCATSPPIGIATVFVSILVTMQYSGLDFRDACIGGALSAWVPALRPICALPLLVRCVCGAALLAWSVFHVVLAWTARVDEAHEFLLFHFAPELHANIVAASAAGDAAEAAREEARTLAATPMPPVVFVSGLPRSGTTYLFGLLAEVLPSAVYLDATLCALQGALLRPSSSTPRDGAFEARANAQRNRKLVDAYFVAVGQSTRLIDRVAASGATAEEYQHALLVAPTTAGGANGRNLSDARALRTFRELCKRVALAGGGSDGAPLFCLQKNPADAAHEHEMHALLPSARFVHISRDPIKVLNSFVTMVLHTAEFESLNPYVVLRALARSLSPSLTASLAVSPFSSLCDPLLVLLILLSVSPPHATPIYLFLTGRRYYALFSPSLLKPSPRLALLLGIRTGFSLYDVGISFARLLRIALGRAVFTRAVAWVCAHAIRDWAQACDDAHAAIPPRLVCDVTFDELVSDPAATAERICAFLGTAPRRGSLSRVVPAAPRPFRAMEEVTAVAHILAQPAKRRPGLVALAESEAARRREM
jgi:hypothetical protein